MARRKKIARQIREQGADYVLRVRANHKGLHRRLQDTWDLERAGGFAGYAHDYADTVGKGHGRIESRRCWTTGDPDLLAHVDPDREWRDLASLVWVESERRCGDRVSTEVRGFISSLPPKAQPQPGRCASIGPSRTPTTGSWMSPSARTAAASAPATRPTTWRSRAHRPQPAAPGHVPRVGIANKRLAAAWNKDYLCQLIGLKPKPI